MPAIQPDLSSRPFQLTVERTIAAALGLLFQAWTEKFDLWFAAPSIITVELTPSGKGTHLWLTHIGFSNEESRDVQEQAWPKVLEDLDQVFRPAS